MLATRAGMLAERLTRAFWPLWSVAMLLLAPLMMGWQDFWPVEVIWTFVVLGVLALTLAFWVGLRKFRLPTGAEALARVDARLPGNPIAALRDQQAIGRGDAASEAVWQAHVARMTARSRAAKAVEPDLRVSARDPFGLRYIALLCFVVALLFGSVWRVGSVTDAGANGTQQLATGPMWEGWIEPPAYTGRPSLYLADIPPGPLSVPVGSKITLRLYGEVGALMVDETVSGRLGTEVGAASDLAQTFTVTQEGRLAIRGEGGAEWDLRLIADAPPTVELTGAIERDGDGQMKQPFHAADDYAVQAGTATIALDIDAVDRAYGLSADPDPRAPLVIDLPMPFNGERDDFEDILTDDLSEHPFANMPVTITLHVTDALGQEGASPAEKIVLPGRRFFQPMARVVAEQRRDLLWSKSNAPRVAQLLRAVSWKPEEVFPNNTTYLRLRVTIRRLESLTEARLTDEGQAEIAKALWDLAVQLEDGTLADARERLRRAQEALAEAMRNGADPAEIQRLMNELRDATDDYMQMLADQMEPQGDQTDQADNQQQSQEFSMSELQALMDRIQQLMEEGKMAEAQQLMQQLNDLLENMQITQGDGTGDGPRTPGQQSMQDLSDTLRDQQDLSDQAFRDLQDQFNQGQQGQQGEQGDQGQQGQQPGQQPGQQGETGQQPGEQGQNGQQEGQPGQNPNGGQENGQQGQGQGVGNDQQTGQQSDQGAGGEGQQASPQGLANRQQALRDLLQQQRRNLPSLSGEAADNAERSLDMAEGAMDGAEEALRQGDYATAIDRQSEAMDALRNGMRALGEALAQNRQGQEQQPGQGGQAGEAQGRVEPARRDPLGRQLGNDGQFGTDQNMLQGPDVYRRAEELLQELRRRSAEQQRPEVERDYLRRLLDRF